MMIQKRITGLLFIVLLLAMSNVRAQIPSDSITVISNYTPTIADAYKISNNPSSVDSAVVKGKVNYSIQPKAVNTTFTVEPIKPAVMVGEPLTKLYRSLLKVGIGTYTTPYGEYFFNNLRSKEHSYGLHLKHISSVATLSDVGYSSYSDNVVNLYGKKFLRKHTLSGDLDYSRNAFHFYGYNPVVNVVENEVTRQQLSFFSPQVGLMSHFTDSSKTNYDVRLKYYNFSDYYKASESNVKADALFKAYVEKQLLNVVFSVDYYHNRNGIDTSNNTIVKLNPSFAASGEKWKTSIGVNLCTDISLENKFYFYPSIDFNYDIIDNILVPYAGIGGGLKKNSLKSMTDENPFTQTDLITRNTNRKYDLYGGIRGTIGATVFYNTNVSFARMNSMLFFVNDFSQAILKNRFVPVYDDVNITTLHGELQYQADEKLRLLVKGDYFKYKMDLELQPWHKPPYQLTFSANYNLQNKIVARAELFVYGKRQAGAKDATGAITATELKGYTDVNIGLEYRYTKILSAFLNFNNLLSTRYYQWSQYPSQRINILGGISYAF